MRRLDRRWWIALGVAVVAIVALVYSAMQRPPAECRQVNDLLEFNQAQGQQIKKKTEGSNGLPTAADDLAYQAWADGLAERARKIDAPELRFTATELADLANAFVRKLPDLRAASASHAPGAPPPTVVYEMDALNAQIERKTAELSDACSG